MSKLMYAVRGADHSELRDPSWHRVLAEAGVHRLQLNLDDEPVAPALRLSAGAQAPFTAVVSVWLDDTTAPAALEPALARIAGEVHGWLVAERRPLDPPETADGTRADALANVALLRRPAELDAHTWVHRWLTDHTPVAIATQGTFGYVQNVVAAPVTPAAAPVAALVEELFPAAAVHDVHAFYGSTDDADLADRMTRMMASVARFGADRDLDLVPGSRYLIDLTGPG